MTKLLKVPVSYYPQVGYVTISTHEVPKTVTALSLTGLRKRVMVVAARMRRPNEPISVMLDLDPAAAAEQDRRRAAAEERSTQVNSGQLIDVR